MEPTLSHVPDRSCHVPPVPLSAVRRRPGRGLASAPWRSLWWIHRSQVPPQSRSDLHLIFAADGQPLLVVASCAHRVDTRRVAALIGAGKVRLADPEPVISATGQTIGGVRAPAPTSATRRGRRLVGQARGGVGRPGRRADDVPEFRWPNWQAPRAERSPTSGSEPSGSELPQGVAAGARRPRAECDIPLTRHKPMIAVDPPSI
jgi:Aminoacyl-tRNA editing domain